MGGRMAAGGHWGPRQKIASRLGASPTRSRRRGRPSGARCASPGAVVALVVLHGDPRPALRSNARGASAMMDGGSPAHPPEPRQ